MTELYALGIATKSVAARRGIDIIIRNGLQSRTGHVDEEKRRNRARHPQGVDEDRQRRLGCEVWWYSDQKWGNQRRFRKSGPPCLGGCSRTKRQGVHGEVTTGVGPGRDGKDHPQHHRDSRHKVTGVEPQGGVSPNGS
jgi:hypothetical protein